MRADGAPRVSLLFQVYASPMVDYFRESILSFSLLALALAFDRGAPGCESGGDDPVG